MGCLRWAACCRSATDPLQTEAIGLEASTATRRDLR